MIKRALYPHQELAFEYGMRTKHPALFMAMRLGKSLVSIRLCEAKGLNKVLIIAPKTTLEAWRLELHKERKRLVFDVNVKTKKQQELIARFGINWGLCTYEYAVLHASELEQYNWDAVILDESTRIKNPKTRTFKTLNKYFHNAERFILSGCPAPEDPLEYVCQLIFADGEILNCDTYWNFRSKHCRPPRFGYEWTLYPSSKKQLQNFIKDRTFTLTREAAGFFTEEIREVRIVPSNTKQIKAYKELLTKFACGTHTTKHSVVVATWMAQVAGGFFKGEDFGSAKLTELVCLLEGELLREKVVVFFCFNAELQEASKLLSKHKIKHRCITGATPKNERKEICRKFSVDFLHRDSGFRVVLAQTKCVKYGLDFASASTAIYYSNRHSSEERIQSEQRIVHLQKNETLLYIDLVASDSCDNGVLEALNEKRLDVAQFTSEALQEAREALRITRKTPLKPGKSYSGVKQHQECENGVRNAPLDSGESRVSRKSRGLERRF